MASLRELQQALLMREQNIRDRDKRLSQMELQLNERDSLIVQLRAELDKCHQVLKPIIQQQLITTLQSTSLQSAGAAAGAAAFAGSESAGAAIASSSSPSTWRKMLPGSNGSFFLAASRTKRLAISAEPSHQQSMEHASANELRQLRLQRTPKSSK